MRQAGRPIRTRQKRCLCCRQLFSPDPRSKNNQRYCSHPECQRKRQRRNEASWRARNPDCLQRQYEQARQWRKSRPDYYRERRHHNHPYAEANRRATAAAMRRLRQQNLFAKSKSILTQLTGKKQDECFLTQGAQWLLLRLPKASPLFRLATRTDNVPIVKQNAVSIPQQKFYPLTLH